MSDSEGEAEETRVWLEFSLRCKFISEEAFETLDVKYDLVIGQLVTMINQPEKWTIR